MRLLFLADAKSYHTQRWVDYFVNSGHQCFLITLDRGLETKAEEFYIPSRILPNFLKYPLSLRRVKEVASRIKPDLINAHFIPSYGLIGARLKFHPLVISTWGSDVLISPQKSRLHKLRAEYILKKADLVTTDAYFTAEAIAELGVSLGKVLVSPMGIERVLLGSIEKIEKPYLTIFSNRKLEPLYDVATFIKAIPLVLTHTKADVKFVILGEGSQKNRLIQLTKHLGLDNRVEFGGVVSREKLLQYYQDSDIYISTSKSDSTSVSLLEAMSFGSIPVVTDIPGNREWIEDSVNGFIFPTSDYKILAERIIHLIRSSSNYYAGIREKNLSIIQKRAVWENNMQVIEESFCRLVNRNRVDA
jgi:L-malate glycosyltransferase